MCFLSGPADQLPARLSRDPRDALPQLLHRRILCGAAVPAPQVQRVCATRYLCIYFSPKDSYIVWEIATLFEKWLHCLRNGYRETVTVVNKILRQFFCLIFSSSVSFVAIVFFLYLLSDNCISCRFWSYFCLKDLAKTRLIAHQRFFYAAHFIVIQFNICHW